jgi:ParB family chromosome partitioning protein
VGKNRVTITNTLRLLKLPEAVQRALAEEKINEGHARALLGLNNPQAQIAGLHSIVLNNLTVRQAEELVRKMNGEKSASRPTPAVPPEVAEIEERLRLHLGTRVNLHYGKKGGSVVIHYYSDEELNALLERILKE